MDILDEIRQKLRSGKKPLELVKEGYAKSSVYYVAKQLRNVHSGIPSPPVDDEVTELRRRKEIIKLERDIADLAADKQRLPERIAKLETNFQELRDNLFDLWVKQTVEALQELECPQHGRKMGMVLKCRECSYEMGLVWGKFNHD